MIRGLTDNVLPAFPFLGKLRKGGEKQDGKVGKELKYWRFTSENPDVVRAFHEAYGDQPVAISVYLPYPDVLTNWATWKEKWVSGGLDHRCDGEVCQIWRTDKGTYSREPKPCPGQCKDVGRLVLWLPELIKAGYVGFVTMETHSNHDLRKITGTLNAVAQTRANDPLGLQGIEFTLRRKKEMISTPDGRGGRATREKWLVSIEPVASWAATYLSIAAGGAMGVLPSAPGMVDAETGEIFDDYDDEDDDVVDGDYTPLTGAAAEVMKSVGAVEFKHHGREMQSGPQVVRKAMDKMRDESDHAPMREPGDVPLFDDLDNDPDPTIDSPGESVWNKWQGKSDAIAWAYSVGFQNATANKIWTTVQTTGKIGSKDMPKPFYDTVLDHIASGGQDFEPTVNSGEKARL